MSPIGKNINNTKRAYIKHHNFHVQQYQGQVTKICRKDVLPYKSILVITLDSIALIKWDCQRTEKICPTQQQSHLSGGSLDESQLATKATTQDSLLWG